MESSHLNKMAPVIYWATIYQRSANLPQITQAFIYLVSLSKEINSYSKPSSEIFVVFFSLFIQQKFLSSHYLHSHIYSFSAPFVPLLKTLRIYERTNQFHRV